jgi:hypothetical protein
MFQRIRHLPNKPQKENEMAKKQAVNKTELIKEALTKNPKGSPIEIAGVLKKHGVTAQYVSTVKFKMGEKKTKTVKKATKKATRKTKEASFTVTELVKASKLADDLGGVERTQELLNALGKLS